EGRGFEISQVRLGPGRIHHCMRTIGKAEKALDLMVSRGLTREAFGKKIAHLGGNLQIIAQARCEIEAMRLMVLKAAKAMDVLGNKEARIWVSMVKAMVPERTCKIMIVMVKTNPDAPPSKQQSQILVPKDTPGVEIIGPMHVFGHDHAPRGHMHLRFNNVRVPKENMLLGEGRGFEISQVRLGPGRIHHCMRTIGKAEKALDLMVSRGLTREAFGKKIAHLGGNLQIVAQARCEIEAMRLMVLKAAKAMDVLGNKEARVWVSMVKAMVPERTCKIIDQAIQMHGATGISQWTPLAEMYQDVRHLRFADGPDEVHWMVVGRHELSMP
ncbi:MAG TPA: acyl-CoA dehydrogenase family protein, partial [Bradyrhizobium sp.]